MKQKTVLIALAMLITILITTFPIGIVSAWEYSNTTIKNPQTDNISEMFGPMADHVQIKMYTDEISEFTGLELKEIDVTDWPVDATHYPRWVDQDPYNSSIAVVDTGPEYGMYILDMRMNNETRIYKQVGASVGADLGPNPAYTAPFGNPMADVWLRRAIGACKDRKYVVEQIVSGGVLPLLASPLYSVVNDPPYTGWGLSELNPTGAYKELTYAKADGSNNCTLANWILDTHGYPIVAGKRTKGGVPFYIEFYYRTDHTYRKLFAERLYKCLTDAPPAGLGLDVHFIGVTSAGGRQNVMADKKGHMYTGGWGLTTDPDHLYYLFHINNYFHPGRPMNYMYYPGDYAQIKVPYDGWQYNYTNVPSLLVTVNWGAAQNAPYQIDFSDYDKTWNKNDMVWVHPQNYWSWEMMIAPNYARALDAAHKSELALAFYEIGDPVWASRSFTAFARNYTGPEPNYTGKAWKGVVNQKGFGVWSTRSFYNMHTAGDQFGDGTMTIRWAFRQPTMSLNPIYAEWIWDWYVLNQAYDSGIGLDPYVNSIEVPDLCLVPPELSTWDGSTLGLGTCSKVTFHLRHDLVWSDGVPLTASDFVFSWGGHKVAGSIANLLDATGQPPAYWDGQIADMLSVAAPDPFTVIVYMDVYAYFATHSMSGFNIVLPEHVWKPIILAGTATNPWNQPCVVAGGYKIRSTAQPTLDIWLDANTQHFQYRKPLMIWTDQKPSTTPGVLSLGQTHWIFPGGSDTADVTLDLHIHNQYVYENGTYKENVYRDTWLDGYKNVTLWKWNHQGCPNDITQYTQVDGLIENMTRWQAKFCEPIDQPISLGPLLPDWYYTRVDVYVDSLSIGPQLVWTNTTNVNLTAPISSEWDGHTLTSWIDKDRNGQLSVSDWIDDQLGNFWKVEALVWNPVLHVWEMEVKVLLPTQLNPFYGHVYTYREYFLVTLRYDYTGLLWKPCPPATAAYQPMADLTVDMKDIRGAAKCFGAYPGHPRWNPQADMVPDFVVDMRDIRAIAKNFGWSAPA